MKSTSNFQKRIQKIRKILFFSESVYISLYYKRRTKRLGYFLNLKIFVAFASIQNRGNRRSCVPALICPFTHKSGKNNMNVLHDISLVLMIPKFFYNTSYIKPTKIILIQNARITRTLRILNKINSRIAQFFEKMLIVDEHLIKFNLTDQDDNECM